MPEVVENGRTGYIVDKGESGQIAKAVIKYFKENRQEEFKNNIIEKAKDFSWERMTERLEKLMKE